MIIPSDMPLGVLRQLEIWRVVWGSALRKPKQNIWCPDPTFCQHFWLKLLSVLQQMFCTVDGIFNSWDNSSLHNSERATCGHIGWPPNHEREECESDKEKKSRRLSPKLHLIMEHRWTEPVFTVQTAPVNQVGVHRPVGAIPVTTCWQKNASDTAWQVNQQSQVCCLRQRLSDNV